MEMLDKLEDVVCLVKIEQIDHKFDGLLEVCR